MKRRMKRQWVQLAVRKGNPHHHLYYLNGVVYTDLDEPLRLARRHAETWGKNMRMWKKPQDILLAGYRTSAGWGDPHTDKLPFEKIWPIFEAYARML